MCRGVVAGRPRSCAMARRAAWHDKPQACAQAIRPLCDGRGFWTKKERMSIIASDSRSAEGKKETAHAGNGRESEAREARVSSPHDSIRSTSGSRYLRPRFLRPGSRRSPRPPPPPPRGRAGIVDVHARGGGQLPGGKRPQGRHVLKTSIETPGAACRAWHPASRDPWPAPPRAAQMRSCPQSLSSTRQSRRRPAPSMSACPLPWYSGTAPCAQAEERLLR